MKFHQNTSIKTNDIDLQSESLQRAAEYLSMTVDGRSKIYYDDFTFENIKELLDKVRNSEYKKSTTKRINENHCVGNENELSKTTITVQGQTTIEDESTNRSNPNDDVEFKSEAPSATILPPPIFSNPDLKNPDMIYSDENEKNKFVPNVLENSSTEPTLFKEQPIHIRPISEVIGVGNFFFIQDSEIDVPESESNMKTETFKVQENQIQTIQSQTFTNQSMISNGSQNSFQKDSELNVLENFDQSPQSVFLKVDSPNASNLPMPGFPALGKTKHDIKNIDNIDKEKDGNNDWKSQINEYETSKWTSNEDKSSNNRQVPRSSLSDRNGNAPRSQLKQNGLRGNSHNNYFKNNDLYYQQQGMATNNNSFRAPRNVRERGDNRGNSYPSRPQK